MELTEVYMIKLERFDVMNMDNAVRGMRNPMQSQAKSDSGWNCVEDTSPINPCDKFDYIIGPEDMKLARGLIKGGSDERKFLRQIMVSVDITAPLYWWKEYDTYKVGTVANSESTMHRIHAKPFCRGDFSCERMTPVALACLDHVIIVLEDRRLLFVETKERAAWDDMIQLLPESYNQMRTCTLNYEVLMNQYFARRNHKLTEWREFCAWAEELPYFKQFKEVLEK
jgi:hypothetical protein